jgi:hypothetical protein
MNKRILGGDICKDRVVCWMLEKRPSHLRNYWKSEVKHRSKDPVEDELTFYFTKKGISHLLKLKPDAIVLEPTGVHYSWLLAHICQCEGIEVLWVGHAEATHYRKGMAGDELSSGDRKGWNAGSGSKMCRTELYMWILVAIAPKGNRPRGAIGERLGEFYDKRQEQFEKNNQGGNHFGKLIINQTAAYGCKLLFKELKKALKLKKG